MKVANETLQGRRRSQRFPLHFDLIWRRIATDEEGEGKTVDISGTGILFCCGQEFGISDRLELSICWPVKIDGKVPLKLVALVRVTRREAGRIAVKIERHELRLEGVRGRARAAP